MRYTVVDADGATSFVGPAHLLKMLAAACSRGAADLRSLLGVAEEFDPVVTRDVMAALARLDADDAPGETAGGRTPTAAADASSTVELFRVVDDASREQSLTPARHGLVVFNLPARRIVQVQNSYADLRREDRGRLRRNGRPVRAYYRYQLPESWQIVP